MKPALGKSEYAQLEVDAVSAVTKRSTTELEIDLGDGVEGIVSSELRIACTPAKTRGKINNGLSISSMPNPLNSNRYIQESVQNFRPTIKSFVGFRTSRRRTL